MLNNIIKYILMFFFIPFLVLAQTNNDNINDKFESIIKEANSKGVFSGNVLISKDGSIFQKSIGNADEEKNIPNTTDTKFQTGSITKFFTKTIIYQLTEENKINLSDNLGKYLSGFSLNIANDVTIQELLDHTSGFGDYLEGFGNPKLFENIKSVSDVLPIIQKEQLQFTPGSKAQYSNSGYAILANIIEKVEGKKYGDILQERIFNKIEMNNSGFSVVNIDVPNKAKGYLSNELGPKRDNSEINIIGVGDGGIFTTTGDLLKFIRSITSDNRLLKDESKLRLFNSPLFPAKYATWKEFLKKGKFAIAGGAPGISAVMGLNIEKNYIIIVLSNYDEGTAQEIIKRFSDILNDKQPKPFNPPPARVIYNLIKEKGGQNFISNYKTDLQASGISLDDDMILLYAGKEFLREQDADGAIALYTVYTREFPNIVIAWNDMGDAYLLKGKKVNAKMCYENALKIRPENKRAQESLHKLN